MKKNISQKNLKIYQIATADNAPTMAEIGKQYGISRARVSAIVKQVQAALGDKAVQIDREPKFPILKSIFSVTPAQAKIIDAIEKPTHSKRMRFLIDFYGQQCPTNPILPESSGFTIQRGGFYISKEQQVILDTVPEKNYPRKMRHIIEFYKQQS